VSEPAQKQRKIGAKEILLALVAIYVVALALANTDEVSLDFVFFTANTRLIWLVLLSVGLGVLLALFGPRLWRARRKD
jgi:uncharacterized integral membrane protein